MCLISTDDIETCSPVHIPIAQRLGFKLVGDNIDKTVKARYMRAENHRNKSLHYFHYFAVQNRIDHSSFPDVHVQTCLDSPKRRALSLLPSKEDDRILRSNIVTMVSRVLTKHMPFFKHTFEDIVQWHIKHQYYAEMSSKSVVVGKMCTYFYLLCHIWLPL